VSTLRARLGVMAVVAALLPAACSLAGEDPQVAMAAPTAYHPGSAEAVTAQQCSACHIAYSPTAMPGRSWQALMSHLSSHFGEDASLDAPTEQAITRYLVSHAADSRYGDRYMLRGLAASVTPERITDMPWWRRQHRRLVERGAASGPGVRAGAQCQTCHGGHGAGADDDN
jgi:cytochrome c5